MADGTVKVQSTRFGELEVPASSIITVVGGLIGFQTLTKYTLLEYNPPFSWLQSLDRADMAFVVVNAAEFGDEYSFALPEGDAELQLTDADDVAIINLVSVRPDPMQTTVNLKAPIIVNLRNMRGRQVVLDNPRFPVRMPLWVKEDSKEGGEKK